MNRLNICKLRIGLCIFSVMCLTKREKEGRKFSPHRKEEGKNPFLLRSNSTKTVFVVQSFQLSQGKVPFFFSFFFSFFIFSSSFSFFYPLFFSVFPFIFFFFFALSWTLLSFFHPLSFFMYCFPFFLFLLSFFLFPLILTSR